MTMQQSTAKLGGAGPIPGKEKRETVIREISSPEM